VRRDSTLIFLFQLFIHFTSQVDWELRIENWELRIENWWSSLEFEKLEEVEELKNWFLIYKC
jgi:hypothetical protein